MSKWWWPCPGHSTITSGVGPRWGSSHKGIDIGAPKGASIVASREGKVTRSVKGFTREHQLGNTDGGGYGNHVYVDHQDGYITRYAHMTQVYVNEGEKVTAGQVLGTVGSTGSSTGYHLHFEIRHNGSVVDPELYVNPDNSIVANDITAYEKDVASDYGSINNGVNDYSSVYDTTTSGPIIPTVSSNFTNGRPIHAYLRIWIGGHELIYDHKKPHIFMRFEFNKLEEAGSEGQLVIFDDNWDEIEYYLSKNPDDILIQYGYAEGEREGEIGLSSPVYRVLLSTYSLEFRDTGVILSIKLISLEVKENLSEITALDTGTKNPTEAIRAICNYMKWPIDESNFVATEDVDRTENYKFTKDTAMNIIWNSIIPEAFTKDGEIVSFYITPEDDRKARLVSKSFSLENEKSIKTYVYQKGIDSVVESISFDAKGTFGGTSSLYIATDLKGNTLDPYEKNEASSSHDTNSVVTGATGLYTMTDPSQSSTRVVTAAETLSQMNNHLKYRVKNSNFDQYEATMTILGDPEIELFDEVRIINMTEFGFLHHTSGIYRVKGITDTIENGMYRTSLKLHRNCDISEGTILVNPRWQKK